MKITIHQRQIEALFHRAAQAAETARDTASVAAGLAGRRAEAAAERRRLERAAADVTEEIELQMGEIGRLIYATHTGTPSDSGDVQNILEYVDSLYEQLEGHEAELKRMRGLLLCACCGAENEGDWVYCRSCGQPLERT